MKNKVSLQRHGFGWFLALLLGCCLVVGFCSLQAFGASTSTKTLKKETDLTATVGETGGFALDSDYDETVTSTGDGQYTHTEYVLKSVTSKNSSVVRVSDLTYEVLAPGSSELVVTYTKMVYITDSENGTISDATNPTSEDVTFTVTMTTSYDMSDVTLSSSAVTIYATDYDSDADGVGTITLQNTPYTMSDDDGITELSVFSSNDTMSVTSSLRDNVITFNCTTPGTTTLTITVNGKSFNVTLTMAKLTLVNTKLMAKGKTATLKVKMVTDSAGTTTYLDNSKITWSSSKSSVATVSSSGKIKAKKCGNTVIYACVGNVRLGCALSVATAKKVKAIKKAVKIGDTCTYSQARRMRANYYDCSSLVWRAYKSAGITVVSKKTAPVAATIAKWLIQTKKHKCYTFSYSDVQKMVYNAGDLGFKTGAKNGRYKGIYHVEMFIGYTYQGYADGSAVLSPRWANRDSTWYHTSIIVKF